MGGISATEMMRTMINACNKKQGAGAAVSLLDSDIPHENLQCEKEMLCSPAPCGLVGFRSTGVTLHSITRNFWYRASLDSVLSKQKSERCRARICYDKFLDADKEQSGEHTCAGGLVMLLKEKNKNGGRHRVATQGFHNKYNAYYYRKQRRGGGVVFCFVRCLADWGISAGNDPCAIQS